MKDKIIAVVAIIALITTVGIVGRMDYKLMEQEQAWNESVQAAQLEQAQLQEKIIRLQGQFDRIEDMYIAQGIWIKDVRERLHFEFIDELEAGLVE